jgi:hypothetical protein
MDTKNEYNDFNARMDESERQLRECYLKTIVRIRHFMKIYLCLSAVLEMIFIYLACMMFKSNELFIFLIALFVSLVITAVPALFVMLLYFAFRQDRRSYLIMGIILFGLLDLFLAWISFVALMPVIEGDFRIFGTGVMFGAPFVIIPMLADSVVITIYCVIALVRLNRWKKAFNLIASSLQKDFGMDKEEDGWQE